MRAFILAAVVLAACEINTDPGDAGPQLDAGPPAGCSAACAQLAELGCPAGEPAEDGTPCETVCAELEQLLEDGYHTACVSSARSCMEADQCFE